MSAGDFGECRVWIEGFWNDGCVELHCLRL
jgi:hypothetical protein